MKIIKKPFGTTSDGQAVELYTLTNSSGITAEISTFGGAVVSLKVPDRAGNFVDVVLGYDTLKSYEDDGVFLGALIGRHGNRIAKGRFDLNGKTYELYCNDGNNHLHGGRRGFDKKVWQPKETEKGLELTYVSPDGEEGYPGNLTVTVCYSLTDDGRLVLDYTATTDQDTVCNLTNHSYFNLAGQDSGPITGQYMQIFADEYTWADKEALPTGEIRPVEGTPLDLRKPVRIGDHIDDDFDQLQFAGGYDHNWVVNGQKENPTKVAYSFDKGTGIAMTTWSTLPGMQFYSGNFLDGKQAGKGGAPNQKRWGYCLETQFFPNALVNPNFEQPILKKGEKFHHITAYQFGLYEE